MAVPWIDLISGKPPVSAIPLLYGQWVAQAAQSGLAVNGIKASRGDRLLGRGDGRWSFESASRRVVDGTLDLPVPASEGDEDALLRLEEAHRGHEGWDEWVAQSPLVPEIESHIGISPFDELLEKRIASLEEVFRAPRDRLKIETELLRASRARRISSKAVARLASHKEDWERRTMLGVHPRRVLCLTPTEEYDLYENRVAVRLVDHLRKYLSIRIERIDRVLRMIGEKDHSEESSGVTHWQRDRLCRLWADAVKDDSAQQVALKTRRKLEALHLRVLSLLDSPLYRAIPRSVRVTGLRYTNIFTNDGNYRQVAALWKAWERNLRSGILNEQERYRREQRVWRGMACFARLLVIRALAQIGFLPREVADGGRPPKGSPFEAIGYGIEVAIRVDEDGSVIVDADGRRLRIVPFASTLVLKDVPDSRRAEVRQALEESARTSGSDGVVILRLPAELLGDDGDTERTAVTEAIVPDWTPVGASHGHLAGLPVSPWSIFSVERVARCMLWHLYIPCLEQFPPSISPTVPVPGPSGLKRREWIEQIPGSPAWAMLQVPTEASVSELVREYENRLVQELSVRGGKTAQRAKADASDAAESLRARLEAGKRRLDALRVCPVCKDPHAKFSPRDAKMRTFVVECAGCGASWGIHACGGDGQSGRVCGSRSRVPFLQVDGFTNWVRQRQHCLPEEVVARFGADMLSIPVRDASGKPAWRCVRCILQE